jgi:hydrogenase maturation protein HypF
VSIIRRAIGIRGVVQGVGFRPFVFLLAERHGLAGFVRNVAGEVEIEVEGDEARVGAFVRGIESEAPRLAVIAGLEVREAPPQGEGRFLIRESEVRDGASLRPVSPDAATCDACVRDIADPADRRYRYPFTNCTDCGPRFTIIDDLPYDRPSTSMARFTMCEACRREYEDPRDRRFHAQPVACPRCGPRLAFRTAEGHGAAVGAEGEAALAAGERLIAAGGILALRGLGGFQLACDARSEAAVRRLRERKRRLGKPLAIMVRDLEAARALCEVAEGEARALSSVARPIVLLRRRGPMAPAPSVAPGLSTLGVMLPYTPLHHLLAGDLGFPLVMTSGNVSEEPIATENAEAVRRLRGIADGFLFHDRDIRARYDDSVVRVIGEGTVPLRRARGLAPAPLALPFEAAEEVLALGGHQKSAFCLVKGGFAYLGQHIGDLDNLETLAALRAALSTYRRLFRLAPRAVAHDLHPDYLSTREAHRIAREERLPEVAVQHHHAHLAACLVDNGRTDRAVGLVFDGSGLGPDGAVWGGEVLVGDLAGYERRGHIAPVRLPGSARAIRRPDRVALAWLLAAAPGREDLLDEAARTLPAPEARVVRQQIATGFNAPLTTSAGRVFDAAAVLLGLGPEARYEGELACALEAWADDARGLAPAEPLPWDIRGDGAGTPVILDPGPMLVALLERRLAGEDPRRLAAAFHEALARLAVEAARRVARACGVVTVALSGGCFQNRILAERCAALLAADGLEPLLHRRAPPNDGGLALGQAAVAAVRIGAARR